MPDIKSGELVLCLCDNGYLINEEVVEPLITHFDKNAVVRVDKLYKETAHIYHIKKNARFAVERKCLRPIDVFKTGKGYSKKICNVCFVLKPNSAFEVNQTDAKGNKIRRPSCRDCRRGIDKRRLSKKVIKQYKERHKPKDGSVWICPICLKRGIVGVTVKIVLDHDKAEGKIRNFLCDSCNTGLGRFKNGENYLKNAIKYLQDYEKKSS